MPIDKEFQPIVDAAKAGGEVLKKYFGQKLDVVNEKYNPADLQTTADLEAEKSILQILEKSYPDYNIISEEIGEIDKNSDYTFVIDPLDGTNNFTIGIPYFSTSIALMKNEDVIFGAVYNPIADELYYAQIGQGAFLNGRKISVNNISDFEHITVSDQAGYNNDRVVHGKFKAFLYKDKKVKRVLEVWSVALDLCLLASGRIEAIVSEGAEIHDFMAGRLICHEAGAKITDFTGNENIPDKFNKLVITNNTLIHDELVEFIKKINY